MTATLLGRVMSVESKGGLVWVGKGRSAKDEGPPITSFSQGILKLAASPARSGLWGFVRCDCVEHIGQVAVTICVTHLYSFF